MHFYVTSYVVPRILRADLQNFSFLIKIKLSELVRTRLTHPSLNSAPPSLLLFCCCLPTCLPAHHATLPATQLFLISHTTALDYPIPQFTPSGSLCNPLHSVLISTKPLNHLVDTLFLRSEYLNRIQSSLDTHASHYS